MMPMEPWHELPGVFRRNILTSSATAIGSGMVTVTVFVTTGDRDFLYLGLVLFLLCIVKTASLVWTICTGRYDKVLGLCTAIDPPIFSKRSRIHITLASGLELTLELEHSHSFQKDRAYLLYFKQGTPLDVGNGLWGKKALADGLLGYEEVEEMTL